MKTTTITAALLLSATLAHAQVRDEVEVESAAADTETVRVPRHPRHLRMAVEGLAIQAIGTAWYWRDTGNGWGESNRVDWQLGFKGSALVAKLDGSGWRMDGNPYVINALCHPMSGSLTYYTARHNGYSPLQAFGVSSLLSVSWELFTEWAEYGAPNDLLSTSPAGVAIGESVYQIQHNWKHASKQLSVGAGVNNGDAFAVVGARVSLETPKRVGIGLEIPFDQQGLRSAEFGAKTSLGKYAATEFHFYDRMKRDSRDWDYMTTVSAGPSIDKKLQLADATVDVGTDVYAEFGILKSEAFETWQADHPMAVVRNSMRDRVDPYYYAAGVAVTPRVNVAYKNINIGGKLAAHAFRSINGLDRDQEMMTADPSIKDTAASAQAWLAYTHKNVTLTVDARANRRAGAIDDSRATSTDKTTMFAVALAR